MKDIEHPTSNNERRIKEGAAFRSMFDVGCSAFDV
jgi:hypothetical protein